MIDTKVQRPKEEAMDFLLPGTLYMPVFLRKPDGKTDIGTGQQPVQQQARVWQLRSCTDFAKLFSTYMCCGLCLARARQERWALDQRAQTACSRIEPKLELLGIRLTEGR